MSNLVFRKKIVAPSGAAVEHVTKVIGRGIILVTTRPIYSPTPCHTTVIRLNQVPLSSCTPTH